MEDKARKGRGEDGSRVVDSPFWTVGSTSVPGVASSWPVRPEPLQGGAGTADCARRAQDQVDAARLSAGACGWPAYTGESLRVQISLESLKHTGSPIYVAPISAQTGARLGFSPSY